VRIRNASDLPPDHDQVDGSRGRGHRARRAAPASRQRAGADVSLSHPQIIQTYDVPQEPDGSPAIVMELLPGRNLRQIVSDEGPLPPAVLPVSAEFRNALAVALSRNPGDRHASAAAFRSALEGTPEWRSLGGEPSPSALRDEDGTRGDSDDALV
jgi:hypothetical protein